MSDMFTNASRRRWQGTGSPATASTNSSLTNEASGGHTTTYSSTIDPTRTHSSRDHDGDVAVNDAEFDNILSLTLRKPKHWRWELNTSRSCSNIAMPRILLYDHKGRLLVDAHSQDERTYREEQLPTAGGVEKTQKPQKRGRSRRAATTNLTHSISKTLQTEFDGLQIAEATPSRESATTGSSSMSRTCPKSITLNTNELPDYTPPHRRSNSFKGVRFNIAEDRQMLQRERQQREEIAAFLPTPPSTSTTTLTATPTSSSSGPREKRRYRRSHSSGRSSTLSILERLSLNRRRSSSSENAEEMEGYRPPRYFLRTSKAGTLVVQDESFSHYRRRRRPQKHSSSENIPRPSGDGDGGSGGCGGGGGGEGGRRTGGGRGGGGSTSSGKGSPVDSMNHWHLQDGGNNGHKGQSPNGASAGEEDGAGGDGSLLTIVEVRRRQKAFPIRRYRSDGNVLLRKALSTSDEEEEEEHGADTDNATRLGIREHQQHKYNKTQRITKQDLNSMDDGLRNERMQSAASRTAR